MFTFLFFQLFYLGFSRINYFNNDLPFPFDNYTSKSTIIGKGPSSCISSAQTDGRCNSYNNFEDCSYDGGDCCRKTCVKNCYYSSSSTTPSQMPIENLNNTCPYECGYSGYNCTDSQGCSECYHGTCYTISQCPDTSMKYSYGQCCICEDGWAGFSCASPICSAGCKHGTCISRDNCSCQTGWTGTTCNTPICSSCINGVCISPEVCKCSSSLWTGSSCDEPLSNPACVNGYPISPNVCKCNTGFGGDICDTPLCQSVTCVNGWCINPDMCECYAPYYTANLTLSVHCNDINCADVYGLYCTSCDKSSCLKCVEGFYPSGIDCVSCSYLHPGCLKCNSTTCFKCNFPYSAMASGEGFCDFGGYIEFSSPTYSVVDTDSEVDILLNRLGGSLGKVSVDIITQDLTASSVNIKQQKYLDYQYYYKTITFLQGETSKTAAITIFNTFDESSSSKQFRLIMHNPTGGAILGAVQNTPILEYFWSDEGINTYSYATVEIFDDPDAPYPQSTILLLDNDPIDFYMPYTVKNSDTLELDIFSYYNSSTPMAEGGYYFIVEIRKHDDIYSGITGNCFFPNNDFTVSSRYYKNLLSNDNGDGSYTSKFSIPDRGLYTINVTYALGGVEATIWDKLGNLNIAPEFQIQNKLGAFDLDYHKIGTVSTSLWKAKIVPQSDLTNAAISVVQPINDKISVYINENILLDCFGNCTSSQMNFLSSSVYDLIIDYTHFNENEYIGFSISWVGSFGSKEIEKLYAIKEIGQKFNAYSVLPDEC
ncbi:unnamed protein product [Blepharisma stoltei]|uniref:EGF-like domain-containing protein n=1 Tax=Blepharisma stoltei TaxID=1481888 RepID=A0AAU9J0Z3_9CILI|nr:unnamed protein product [Blepharisma stoltei]